MQKNYSLVLGLVLSSVSLAAEPVQLIPTDRVLVLAPHPDDEVLGCGGMIQDAVAMGLPVRVVFLTNGDANQWAFTLYRKHPVIMPGAIELMGEVRHGEAVRAAKVLGVSADRLTFLGYPDFGTLAIWYKHWNNASPAKGLLSRAKAVPYRNALRPGAPYKGEDIIKDLTSILKEFRPTKIFLSHPADQNGDHAALYLFTHVALWDMEEDESVGRPELLPYLVHFTRWPTPRGMRPTDPLVPPVQLSGQITWRPHPLTAEAVDKKHQAILQHRSQAKSNGRYLLSFVRANELFGDFPPVAIHSTPSALLTNETQPIEPPEQLNEEERAAFVGIERRHLNIENDQVVIRLDLSRPLAREVEASIYLFGWRRDRPFGDMPKLRARIGELGLSLYDQSRKLDGSAGQLVRSSKQVELRLPLATLGDPQRILTSAHTTLVNVPLDWASWRVVDLDPQK